MAEAIYFSGKKLAVTSAKITYKGSAYPISAVTAVEIKKLSADEHQSTTGSGLLVMVVGGGILALALTSAVEGYNGYWAAVLGAVVVGIGVLVALKGDAADRVAGRRRRVHIRLASGDTVIVAASNVDTAKAIRDAVVLAITSRETSVGRTSSVAEELEKLASLRDTGLLSESDWERAKVLFLGKQPDERAESIAQLRKLHELHRSGVLSESEFNMKKWDVLSRSA